MSTELDFFTNDLQSGPKILSLLGTWWDTYQGKEFLTSYLAARGQSELQTFRDSTLLANSAGRLTVPINRTTNWYPLILLKSKLTIGSVVKFGSGPVFGIDPGSGLDFSYGISDPRGSSYASPDKFVTTYLISDSPVNPNIVLIKGVDFTVDLTTNDLLFLHNPFDDSRFIQTPVYDTNGNVTDTEITIWLHQIQFNYEDPYNKFGYAIGTYQPNTSNYRSLINVLYDGLIGGTAIEQIIKIFAVITDVPIVKLDNEIVIDIVTDRNGLLIITDQEVYRFVNGSTPIVVVGQTVHKNDQLVDTVRVLDLTDGLVPVGLSEIALDDGFLIGSYTGPITWNDVLVFTTVTLNVNGKTKIEWPLVGNVIDTDNFWSLTHSNGVASGVSLANLLDVRPNPVGEPTAASLPATIVPLQWLIKNVLRYNTFVVQIKQDFIGNDALDLSNQAIYRKLIPPHKHVVLQLS